VALDGGKDRAQAVVHIQIGLLLATVAQHPQVAGVALQRAVEVEDVPVRVALSKDRDEAADQSGKAIAGGVRRDQALAGELRCRVQRRLDRERRVLGGGKHLGLAIDRAGRGEHDLLHAPRSHGLEHVRRRNGVLLEITPRMLETSAQIGVCLQVKYPIATGDGVFDGADIEDIAFEESHTLGLRQLRDELMAPGAEVVEDHHLDAACHQQVGEVAADEAGPAGHTRSSHRGLPEACAPVLMMRIDGAASISRE
jgi:hypothetical protein